MAVLSVREMCGIPGKPLVEFAKSEKLFLEVHLEWTLKAVLIPMALKRRVIDDISCMISCASAFWTEFKVPLALLTLARE